MLVSLSPRSYVSPVRDAAAAQKRRDVIDAATRFLREESSIAAFSLDTIARRGGVTRLTVYNQFGSRRGLLEAVFDDIAERGELADLANAVDDPDPWRALDRIVKIMCRVWGFEPAIGRLQDALAIDAEFAQVIVERNERRRVVIRSIVLRLHPGEPPGRTREMTDLIFALTGYATFKVLSDGRSPVTVASLLKRACRNSAAGPAAPTRKES